MLEFEGDVAVVDGLIHGETYVVEIDVVAEGTYHPLFPTCPSLHFIIVQNLKQTIVEVYLFNSSMYLSDRTFFLVKLNKRNHYVIS